MKALRASGDYAAEVARPACSHIHICARSIEQRGMTVTVEQVKPGVRTKRGFKGPNGAAINDPAAVIELTPPAATAARKTHPVTAAAVARPTVVVKIRVGVVEGQVCPCVCL